MGESSFMPQRILKLIEERNITKTDVARGVGISVQTLDNTINGSELGCIKLARLADFFNVSLDFFFDREHIDMHIGHSVQGNSNNVSGDITLGECKKEIAHLHELLKEKERTIQILLSKNQ